MREKISSKNVAIVTALLLIVMTITGMSYAYFTVQYEEGDLFKTEGKSELETPEVEFTENKSGIRLENTYPMPDEVGISKSDEYIYTITNNETSREVAIKVVLEVTKESTLEDNLVNYSLNEEINTLGTMQTTVNSSNDYKTSYVIDEFTLTNNTSKTSKLKLWINEQGTLENAQNKTWSSKILVIPTFVETTN